VKVAKKLDWETLDSYTLKLKVEDDGVVGDTRVLSDEVTIEINIGDVNDVEIFSIQASRHPTSGGDKVILQGKNIGPIDPSRGSVVVSAIFGAGADANDWFTALNCIVTTASSEVTCETPQADNQLQGYDLHWKLKVESVNGILKMHSSPASSSTTAYALPAISSIDTGLFTTEGGDNIRIVGNNFGSMNAIVSLTYGPKSDPLLYDAKDCQVTQNNVEIACRSVEGYGKNLVYILRVYRQSSAVTDDTVDQNIKQTVSSYKPPTISNVEAPFLGPTGLLDTRGGDTIRITGLEFGRPRSTNSPMGTEGTFVKMSRDDVALFLRSKFRSARRKQSGVV
jgi:hypothetical protein